MAFYVNVNYQFRRPASDRIAGSVIPASTLARHTLERRRFEKWPHLRRRMFDPQLYMSGISAAEIPDVCARLASYPWFGVEGLRDYDSGMMRQSDWRRAAKSCIQELWPCEAPSTPERIYEAVSACIDFQLSIGCEAILLPTPLTTDLFSDYHNELCWIDSSLAYITSLGKINPPVFASVALSDSCLRSSDPETNSLLDLIADSLSARDIDGVYILLEQGSEPADTRQCNSSRALCSLLHLIHLLAKNAGMTVGVNFVGAFGLICESVGARFWAADWYKSLYRFRVADKIEGGRAWPTYWSYPSLLDIHLREDFDKIVQAGLIERIADETEASAGLMRATRAGASVSEVPAWTYRQGNVSAAKEHFILSILKAESEHERCAGKMKLDDIEAWLVNVSEVAREIEALSLSSTKTRHPAIWLEAFSNYRQLHDV